MTSTRGDRRPTASSIAARTDEAGTGLRAALARAIRPTPELAAEAATLSARYRSGGPPPRLDERRSVRAYAAARMPATFAAIADSGGEGALRLPGFAPRTLLDVGAGPGAATWAVSAVWPTIQRRVLVERSPAAIELGRALLVDGTAEWRRGDAVSADLPRSDVVVAGYLLGEIDDADRRSMAERLWAATRGALLLVEPGSRAGFRRILEARDIAIAGGGHVVAPCPNDDACPVAGGRSTWCHFLARLHRSPLQRRAKDAARSWEDEPFSYVVIARPTLLADPRPRVVLGRPRHRPGVVELRVCDDGRIETVVRSRRDGERYRGAKDLAWGDAIVAAAAGSDDDPARG